MEVPGMKPHPEKLEYFWSFRWQFDQHVLRVGEAPIESGREVSRLGSEDSPKDLEALHLTASADIYLNKAIEHVAETLRISVALVTDTSWLMYPSGDLSGVDGGAIATGTLLS